MVTFRHATGCLTGSSLLVALFMVLLVAPVPAQEEKDRLISELLGEVRKLRAELSAVRNENEILRHRFEILLDRLGVEVEDSPERRRAASVFTPAAEDFMQRGAVRDGTAFPPAATAEQETREPQDRRFPPRELSEQPSPEQDPPEPRQSGQISEQTLGQEVSGQESPGQEPLEQRSPGQALAQSAVSTQRSVEQAAPVKPPARESSRGEPRFALAGRHSRASAQERKAYLDALAHLDTGQYDDLRRALQRFLEDYPGGAYEAKARYLIADSYYTEEHYDRAARHFERYIERFPDADKADDARLKLADVYYRRDELPAAQRMLEELADSRNERVRRLASRKLDLVIRASRR